MRTCRSDAKGEALVGDPHKARIPMRSSGAEHPVVVMKACNEAGAKGLYCSASDRRSTIDWEESLCEKQNHFLFQGKKSMMPTE